jgi:hypothetical protein
MPITVTRPTLLRVGTLKRIHVVGQQIMRNKRDGMNEPCYTIKSGRKNYHCHSFTVLGPVRGVQNFGKRLRSGAVVWLETTSAIRLEA